MTKQEIRDEMIRHLAARLDAFFAENARITTYDTWGEQVTFTIDSEAITTATENLLQSARERIVLVFLNDHSLEPECLDRFVERWLKEAQTFLEEQADAVAAEL